MKKILLNIMKFLFAISLLIFSSCASTVLEEKSDAAEVQDEFILSIAAKEGKLLYISLHYDTDNIIYMGSIESEIKDFKIKGNVILSVVDSENLRLWKNANEVYLPAEFVGSRSLNITPPSATP